jgi:hypothetical protein
MLFNLEQSLLFCTARPSIYVILVCRLPGAYLISCRYTLALLLILFAF